MFKLLSIILPFLKELFSDNKAELDITNVRFNFKKWAGFVLLIFSLFLNYFLITKVVKISLLYINIEEEHRIIKKEAEELKVQMGIKTYLKKQLDDCKAGRPSEDTDP